MLVQNSDCALAVVLRGEKYLENSVCTLSALGFEENGILSETKVHICIQECFENVLSSLGAFVLS